MHDRFVADKECDIDGQHYVAMARSATNHSCRQCVANNDSMLCLRLPLCDPMSRIDGYFVIWQLAENVIAEPPNDPNGLVLRKHIAGQTEGAMSHEALG